ncbi:MAG TPA: hypothetical protein VF331_22380 [Polyangiales bacterium]
MGNFTLKSTLASALALAALASPIVLTRQAAAQSFKLSPVGGAADDEFGHAVAIDGTTAIVGTPGDDTQATDAGAASVFTFNGTSWVLQQKLLPASGSSNGFFGSAVAILGDLAVVGAYGDPNAGAFAGAVYVFRRSGSVWSLSQKLLAADAAATKFFGYSVAMTNDTIAVGASGDAAAGSSAGAAYVFSLAGGSFAQHQKLLAADGGPNNNFGVSIAGSATTLLVGASGDVDNGTGAGSAYAFVRNASGTFVQQQKLVAASGSLNDYFGNAVALSGDTAFVGAFSDDAKGTDAGAVYVFVRNGGAWSQSQKLFAADAAAGDLFGFSVGLTAHDAVIGAPNDSDNGSSSGSVYSFRSNDTWAQRSKLHASDPHASDFFGYAAAVGGANVIVGANGKQDFGANSGAAYVFSQSVTSVPALGTLACVLLFTVLLLQSFRAPRRARRLAR